MSEQNEHSHSLDDAASSGIAGYLAEIGHLKGTPRAGWTLAGVDRPESVADHSFRTAIIGYVLACEEGANPDRTALLCLFHDTPETRLGDIPSVGKRYLNTDPTRVVADQTAGLPDKLGEGIRALVASYESQEDQESVLAKDADKLECLLQAFQYVEAGWPQAKSWIPALMAELSSASAIDIAHALERDGCGWWKDFVENYRSSAAPLAQSE